MTTQIARASNGGTLTFRSGVLRGVGPLGPEGPRGVKGDKGEPGPVGPAGAVNDLHSSLRSTSSVSTASDSWYPVSLDDYVVDEVTATPPDDYHFRVKTTGRYLLVVEAFFEPVIGENAAGTRAIRIVDQANTVLAERRVPATPVGRTSVELVRPVSLDPTRTYRMEAQSDDVIGASLTDRTVEIIRIGAGEPGPKGDLGPVGARGPQGLIGPPGNASSGFSSFDALMTAGGDADVDPGGTVAFTADQAIPYPVGTQSPAVPWFFRRLAEWLDTRVVARFPNATTRGTKRAPAQPGELSYLEDLGIMQMREKDDRYLIVARVNTTTGPPPSGAGQASEGHIWLQY